MFIYLVCAYMKTLLQSNNNYLIKVSRRKSYCYVSIYYIDKDRPVSRKAICHLRLTYEQTNNLMEALSLHSPNSENLQE